MNYAIREMLELLGMNTVDGLTESDIIKGSPSVVGMLHKWTVAICLGLHFHQGMYLSGGSTPAKYDENNSRVMSESIRDQTKSTIDDALNILTYITLENIQYPRLARISLDSNQDARELFLAFAFLICTYQWFNKIEKRSPEYLGFRKCLASAVDEDVDKMIVAQQQGLHSPKTTVENLASLLIPFTNRHDITYDCVYDGLTLPAAITTGFCPSTSNIKKQHSKIDLQKVSDTDNSGRARGKVSPALNDRITTNFALEPTKVVPTKSDKSQTVGIPSWALTPANYTQHKKNDAGAAEDVSSATFRMLEEVHHAILRVSADFEAKSKLLCRSKNVESFDSELLRIVIGQSKQELSFNNLMYSNGIGALCYRGRKCDGGVSNEKHRGPADKKSIQNLKRDDEIQSLMDEIKQLSHTIVQEQYRFRRLLHSLEQGDGERLNLFSGLLGNHTSCDKPVAVRHKGEGNNPTFMGDDYIMPIPAEWVLISQKDPFERHMALLKMIARSLDSETDRSSFFDTALNILKQAKPETSTRRPATAKGSTSRKRISLVTTPNKIKDMVDTLKSFLVEGIPAANFLEEVDLEITSAKRAATDFLRQINSNFATDRKNTSSNYRDKKGGFLNYLSTTLKTTALEGNMDLNSYSDTKGTVNKMLHLFEDATKHDITINFSSLSGWIHQIHNDGGSDEVFPESSKDVDKRHQDALEDEYEARDFEILQQLVNHELPTTDTNDDLDITKHFEFSNATNILHFEHYFNLAREEHRSREQPPVTQLESTFVKYGKLLKEQSNLVLRSRAASNLEAKRSFEKICRDVPAITFLE